MIDDYKNGMSQTAVARKYGVSQSSVSKYVLVHRFAAPASLRHNTT